MRGPVFRLPDQFQGLSPTGIPHEALAQHLAAAGWLYPATLTDDQAVKLGHSRIETLPYLDGHQAAIWVHRPATGKHRVHVDGARSLQRLSRPTHSS